MIRDAVEYLRAHGPELRAEGEGLLQQEIEAVQQALSSGVRSVEDADKIMSGAAGLLERILPDLCWDRVRPMMEDA